MSDFLQVADVLSIPLVRERVDDMVVCIQMCPQFYTSRISELVKGVVRTRYRLSRFHFTLKCDDTISVCSNVALLFCKQEID